MKEWRFEFYDIEHNVRYTLKHDVGGWQDYGVTFGRSTQIANIVKSYSVDFAFYKEDAEWIKNIVYNYGLNQRVKFIVYNWEQEVYVGYLDFTNLTLTADGVSCPINEGGFFQRLENRWNTEYDVKMDSILSFSGNDFVFTSNYTDEKNGVYVTGQPVEKKYLKDEEEIDGIHNSFFFACTFPFLSDKKNQNIADIVNQDLTSSYWEYIRTGSNHHFIRNINKSDCLIVCKNEYLRSVNIKFKGKFKLCIDYGHSAYNRFFEIELRYCIFDTDLFDKNSDGTAKIRDSDTELIVQRNYDLLNNEYSSEFYEDTGDIHHKYLFQFDVDEELNLPIYAYNKSIVLYFFISDVAYRIKNVHIVSLKDFNYEVSIDVILNNSRTLSIVKAKTAFREIMDKIQDLGTVRSIAPREYNVTIDDSILDTVAVGDALTGNLGLRGTRMTMGRSKDRHLIPYGTITTSLEKFLQYLYCVHNICLGCTYDRQTNTYHVYLAKYEDFYRKNNTITQLSGINNCEVLIDNEVLYSEVKIGFEEGEAYNGKREVNKCLTFKSPVTEREEHTLSIVSPYQGAARQIETYIYDNYRNFEDSTSKDSNVYLIDVYYKQNDVFIDNNRKRYDIPVYELKRNQDGENTVVTGGSYDADREWNVRYSPQQILNVHMQELCSYFALELGKKLHLINTESQWHKLKKNGVIWDESEDRILEEEPLYYPLRLTFEAPARPQLIQEVEDNRCGVLTLNINGEQLNGFISKGTDSIGINPMNYSSSTFNITLTDKKILKLL